MNLEFYRCDTCTRLAEIRILMKRGKCVCGGVKVKPTIATLTELVIFVLRNPSYLIQALRGQ